MSTIAELMSRDPLKLSKDDVLAIVQEHRNARHLYQSAPAKAAKPAKASAAEAAGVKLDLGDLGL